MTSSMETTSNFDPAFEQQHIWVAPMWQDREQSRKPRPVLIIGRAANDEYDIVVSVITSQQKWEKKDEFTIPIKHWQYAGLKDESWVRISKIATVSRRVIKQDTIVREGRETPRGYIGKMHDDDFKKVQEKLAKLF